MPLDHLNTSTVFKWFKNKMAPKMDNHLPTGQLWAIGILDKPVIRIPVYLPGLTSATCVKHVIALA